MPAAACSAVPQLADLAWPSAPEPILLVDDDVDLLDMLVPYLQREGFAATAVHDGAAAIAAVAEGHHSLVVLDIMMPHTSGFEALRRIREHSDVPVLMLTARGDDADRVMSLNMGADDHVLKPCSPTELVARIRAILRRSRARPGASTMATPPTPGAAGPVQAGPLRLWSGSRRATWHGQTLALTGNEFCIIAVLARQAGTLVRKPELCWQALGQPWRPGDRRVDVHISAIRQKLGDRPDGRPWIQSVRGQGYQLMVD